MKQIHYEIVNKIEYENLVQTFGAKCQYVDIGADCVGILKPEKLGFVNYTHIYILKEAAEYVIKELLEKE